MLANILLVDDNNDHKILIKEALEETGAYRVHMACNGADCLTKVAANKLDLIILDYFLPDMNGLQVMQNIKQKENNNIPIIIITGKGDEIIAVEAMKLGAYDYVVKSADSGYLVTLPAIVEKTLQNHAMLKQKQGLEQQSKQDFLATIDMLASLIEIKDHYTAGHCHQVKDLAVAIAHKLGLEDREIENIEIGAILHDIGKIGVMGSILNKNGKLTPAEYDQIKKHSILGAEALKQIRRMDEVCIIVKHHHEKYNGQGYPDGLCGEDIPLGARIIHVADTYSAMISDRPYRRAVSQKNTLNVLADGKSVDYDPDVVDALIECLQEVPARQKPILNLFS